ncbi:MAG: helix-turn-helix domain-containing protein [Crocinitomicaceae bacterium]|jgi:excisionase family DNA binding protein|nr:helix-turn-helix domain-containing protein [Crocinitomicaceae bacterium]
MSFLDNDNESNSQEKLVARINQLESEIAKLKESLHLGKLREQYLDLKGASNYLGVSPRSLYRIMIEGELSYAIIGRRKKILVSELEEYVDKRKTAALGSIL